MAADDPTEPRPDQRAREHAEFRSLLIPSREVPRFDPLTEAADDGDAADGDAADGDAADEAPHPVVVTGHAVPRFEPLEGAGEVPGLGDHVVHRRRSSRRRRRRRSAVHRPAVASEPAPEPEPTREPTPGTGRRETLIVVAVLAVLILLAAIYAAVEQADQPSDSGLPQGASRVGSQPAVVRA
ncbi:hypothetical protein [Nocardioides nitrophenolicus]|uniref:hypothetical protein n=1 Tax=Nocardioides nitrophenolicus TaxID=60489 RepID=UPI00195B2D38|nr:hypothetical protein [Nocardioides nitrophenolicus]MBM7518426.1 hypothetical protein [Nocardioides nitrophenolicus]